MTRRSELPLALQEVESLRGLEQLRVRVEALLGVPCAVVQSDKVGEGGAAEYYAFLYRTDRVNEADGPKGVYPEPFPSAFSREPFFATFQAGNFDFTLVTVHVTWGSSSAERTAEVIRLADVWEYVQQLDKDENDILLMGDFNRDKPTHYAFDPLLESGLLYLIDDTGTFTTYSTSLTKVGASWYDNIWMDPQYTEHEYTGSSNVDYIHERFFQNMVHPHIEVRKRISDHCPVWAEFSTVAEDDDPAPELPSEQEPPPERSCQVSVLVEGIELVYNNHVGNDWSFSVEVNGQPIPVSRYGSTLVYTTSFDGKITLQVVAKAVEAEKYPDVGRKTATFQASCLPEPSPSTEAVLEVLVREDRGQYTGNTALWRFRIRIEVEG
jgi:endonuclease/exonuclease/phosphatase family metal-dependent hydrolase